MIKATSFKAPQYIVERLSHLMDILRHEKEKYEQASLTIHDKQFKQNISILAQENSQYVAELTSQLKSLGVYDCIDAPEKAVTDRQPLVSALNSDETNANMTILQFCKDSEKKMISAYRDVLNEPYLFEGLRTIIRRQLNGIMYAFLQLKLLEGTKY
jgi:uncharacterized protein (TIGR02284 family)